jgi:DNA-binding NarL/FixJ family response regulator
MDYDVIRILMADDHRLFLAGLCDLLRREKDFEILGTACTGIEAVDLALELAPDVIVMDVTMPDLNGIKATRRILEAKPGIGIVALSMHCNKGFISEMLNLGARGYVLKESAPEEFMTAVRVAAEGNVYLSPKVATILVEEFRKLSSLTGVPAIPELSARETEVLKLLVKGMNTKSIAQVLRISKNTVDTHRRRILDKMGCENITELTRLALREGLIDLDE